MERKGEIEGESREIKEIRRRVVMFRLVAFQSSHNYLVRC